MSHSPKERSSSLLSWIIVLSVAILSENHLRDGGVGNDSHNKCLLMARSDLLYEVEYQSLIS
jgi:hypothetical protein